MIVLVGRSHREDVWEACGHEASAALLPVVADRGHDDRTTAQRTVDGLLEQRVESEEPAADVDNPPPALGGCVDSGENLGERPVAEVPLLQGRLRVDADKADPVGRCADDRADRRSVYVVGRDDCLVVERCRVRARLELGVREIEAGVDDRDRHAGSRRFNLVVADVVDPPLTRDERVG